MQRSIATTPNDRDHKNFSDDGGDFLRRNGRLANPARFGKVFLVAVFHMGNPGLRAPALQGRGFLMENHENNAS